MVVQKSDDYFELQVESQLPYHRDGEAFIVESAELQFSVKEDAILIAKKARNKSET